MWSATNEARSIRGGGFIRDTVRGVASGFHGHREGVMVATKFPIPRCEYHPTWMEAQAVKFLGDDAEQVVAYMRNARKKERDHTKHQEMWKSMHDFYKAAVRRCRDHDDCPPFMRMRPNRKD